MIHSGIANDNGFVARMFIAQIARDLTSKVVALRIIQLGFNRQQLAQP